MQHCILHVNLPNNTIEDVTINADSSMNCIVDYLCHKYKEYPQLYLSNNGTPVNIHEKISHFLESTGNDYYLTTSVNKPSAETLLNFFLKVPNLPTKSFGPFYPSVKLEAIKKKLKLNEENLIYKVVFTKYDGTVITDESITLQDLNLTNDFPLFATGKRLIRIREFGDFLVPFSCTKQQLLTIISGKYPMLLQEMVYDNSSIFLEKNEELIEDITEKIRSYYS